MNIPSNNEVDIKNNSGPADSLFINDNVPDPELGEGQVLVEIKAFGLNRMDLFQREGKYPPPPGAPKILGVEFSGIIKQLGPGDHGRDASGEFKEGDEVLGLAYGGAYAELIAVSTKMLMHKPRNLSWEEAAGIPETWITATQALYTVGCFTPGETVLWHAGASGVSLSGIQLSKAGGAKAIYVTASSQEKIDFCKTLGATDGFDYKTQNWSEEVLKATGGKGVDVTIDYIGQGYFQGCIDAAAMDGRIVSLAALSGTKLAAGVDIAGIGNKRLRYEGSRLRSRDADYQGKLRDILVKEAMPKFEDGTFKVIVEKVFSWKDVAEAHKLMEQNTSKGKIICVVD